MRGCVCESYCLVFIFIYLIIYLAAPSLSLWHTGALVVACEIFSCDKWDLVL